MHCTRSRHIFRHMHFANGATVQFVGHTFRCNESFATKQMWKVSQCRQIANNSIHFENIAYIMFNWIIYVVIEWTQAARVLSLWMFCILNDAARSVYGFAVTSTKRTSDRPAYDDIHSEAQWQCNRMSIRLSVLNYPHQSAHSIGILNLCLILPDKWLL